MFRDRSFIWLSCCFFLSGFAALLYETAWTREFAFVFGTSELAVATVLAAYMGGLAARRGARRALWRRGSRRPVLAYGLLELGIAIAALAVPLGDPRVALALRRAVRRPGGAARGGRARDRALLPRVLVPDPARADRDDGRDAAAARAPRGAHDERRSAAGSACSTRSTPRARCWERSPALRAAARARPARDDRRRGGASTRSCSRPRGRSRARTGAPAGAAAAAAARPRAGARAGSCR